MEPRWERLLPVPGRGPPGVGHCRPAMLIVRGTVNDVELSGTLYEPGDRVPRFKGAPNEEAPFVWICDEFYEVESGGQVQRIAGQDVNLAFERPMPRGFESKDQAIEVAKEHIRTQFARVGVAADEIDLEVVEAAAETGPSE